MSECNCSNQFCTYKLPESAVIRGLDGEVFLIRVRNASGIKRIINVLVWELWASNNGCDSTTGERWLVDAVVDSEQISLRELEDAELEH